MMKNKTAMMEMLEFIHTLGENYESKMHAVLCQEKAIQLLEVEEEQIFDAYETSHISMMTAEQYYNETYKQQDNE